MFLVLSAVGGLIPHNTFPFSDLRTYQCGLREGRGMLRGCHPCFYTQAGTAAGATPPSSPAVPSPSSVLLTGRCQRSLLCLRLSASPSGSADCAACLGASTLRPVVSFGELTLSSSGNVPLWSQSVGHPKVRTDWYLRSYSSFLLAHDFTVCHPPAA